MKKLLVVGVILLFLGSSIPVYANSIEQNKPNLVPSLFVQAENYSNVNYSLGSVNINYGSARWKWGVVEFENMTTEFDLNYSALGNDTIIVGLNYTLHFQVPENTRVSRYISSFEFFYKGKPFFWTKTRGMISSNYKNWTRQEFDGNLYLSKGLYSNTDIFGIMTVTGLPLGLSYLLRHIGEGYGCSVDGLFYGLFEQKYGTIFTFTIHVHD
jgi:hypothetical protein